MILAYLCINARRSAARPEPSHTTTGTGGVSVTYSNTDLIVLVPPSITKQTTGVLQWVPVTIHSIALLTIQQPNLFVIGNLFVTFKLGKIES